MEQNNRNKSMDQKIANAFAYSWNSLPDGPVYAREQFEDWLYPIKKKHIQGKSVLELGCGNASLMVHMSEWNPKYLVGIDLGNSINSAKRNMSFLSYKHWKIIKTNLINYQSKCFDFVYCIGVLHHLKSPKNGLDAVIRNTKSGGRFHCWVYAKEGNKIIINFIDPIRKITSHLPWWIIKYFIATPLAIPFFIYARLLSLLKIQYIFLQKLPLFKYSLWIAKRNFSFFRHVAFDQLISPQTSYIDKKTISQWLKSYNQVDQKSTYIIMRNGNSWKFGGRILKKQIS